MRGGSRGGGSIGKQITLSLPPAQLHSGRAPCGQTVVSCLCPVQPCGEGKEHTRSMVKALYAVVVSISTLCSSGLLPDPTQSSCPAFTLSGLRFVLSGLTSISRVWYRRVRPSLWLGPKRLPANTVIAWINHREAGRSIAVRSLTLSRMRTSRVRVDQQNSRVGV